MKILIAEDDEETAGYLLQSLREMGHVVSRAASGNDALFLATSETFDVMVLDRMLPGLDGLSVLKMLRAGGVRTPALMLTAKSRIADRVDALENGADDYLIKPFALSELVARIEAILRRSRGSRKRQLQVADLSYDLDTLYVSRAGQPLKLNPLGLKLLAILMQRSPAVVRREALEESLWGDDCPDSDSLRSHIHQLRQVLDKPFPTPLLHTIHGVGYRLAESADAV